jgi:hypothetical protein
VYDCFSDTSSGEESLFCECADDLGGDVEEEDGGNERERQNEDNERVAANHGDEFSNVTATEREDTTHTLSPGESSV